MRNWLYGFLCIFATMSHAVETPPTPTIGGMSEKVKERRARSAARQGGYVEKRSEGRKLTIVFTDQAPSKVLLETLLYQIDRFVRIPVIIKKGPFVECSEGLAAEGAFVYVGKRGTGPTLLVAPENEWASVNTDKLGVDNPSADVFNSRLSKELSRAVALVLGGSDSSVDSCLLMPITSLPDLDNAPDSLSPEPLGKMASYSEKKGYSQIRRVTYKKACQEGWAPAPTNDIQKVIWDEVHTPPTKPLKITYDKDKQKPVVK